MAEQILNVLPFPPLHWNQYSWTAEVLLSAWSGYQERRGPYGAVSSQARSEGHAKLSVKTNDDDPAPPAHEQVRAFQFLMDNESAVSNSVLKAIFAEYPRLREAYGYDDDGDEEGAEQMPAIQRIEQLRPLIGLSNVHVLEVCLGGMAYVGFEFGCTWDEEHGLGVMTHRDRVIEVGGADTSFLGWIADRDSRSSERA